MAKIIKTKGELRSEQIKVIYLKVVKKDGTHSVQHIYEVPKSHDMTQFVYQLTGKYMGVKMDPADYDIFQVDLSDDSDELVKEFTDGTEKDWNKLIGQRYDFEDHPDPSIAKVYQPGEQGIPENVLPGMITKKAKKKVEA